MPLSACPSGVYVFRDVYIRDVFKKKILKSKNVKIDFVYYLLFIFYFFILSHTKIGKLAIS